MSSFLKSLMGRLTGAAAGPQAYLAAFGKHPGWNDHVDDMGFETSRLVAVKRLLYIQGMSANIDAGAWDKLEAEQRLEGFAHTFLWYSPEDLVAGRFWASRDGKGRDKYPMVVCAEAAGVPLAWLLAQAPEVLERMERRCVRTTSAAAVAAQLDAEREGLRKHLPAESPAADWAITPAEVAKLSDCPAFGAEGFYRVLYQIQRSMAAYAPGAAPAKQRRSEQLRLPRRVMAPAEMGELAPGGAATAGAATGAPTATATVAVSAAVTPAASPVAAAPEVSVTASAAEGAVVAAAGVPSGTPATVAVAGTAPASPPAETLAPVPPGEEPTKDLGPWDEAGAWLRFLLAQLHPNTSILILMPLREPFLDVIVGEPTTAQLFCVRAGLKAVPVTSDIPYTLEEGFMAAARRFLDDCRSAKAGAALPAWPRV